MLREAIRIEVSMRNTSPTPVDLPVIADARNRDLTYILSGSSVQQPLSFHYGSAAVLSMPGSPRLKSVSPGDALSTTITVQKYWKDWKPGKHSLQARFGDVWSNRVDFEIVAGEVLSAQVMADGDDSPLNMRVLFLAQTGGIRRLYQAFFPEIDPAVETTPKGSLQEAAPAQPVATEAVAAWTTADRTRLPFTRFGWYGGGKLGIQDSAEEEPPVIVQATGSLVRPAFLTEQGDYLVVTVADRQVSLLRIPPTENGKPTISWQAALPFRPSSARAHRERNGAVHVVVQSEGTSFAWLRDGRIVHQWSHAGGRPLVEGIEPGLAVLPDGGFRVALLLRESDDPKRARLVEWVWRTEGSEPATVFHPPFQLPDDPVQAGVIYSLGGNNSRLDWVVTLPERRIITSRNPGSPRTVEGEAITPLQMLPRKQITYLLMKHPIELLYLAPLF